MASISSIKEKNWVFHALWAASGLRGGSRCVLIFIIDILLIIVFCFRCNVRIPLTILFNEGMPYKALGYDGSIVRIIIDNNTVSNHKNDMSLLRTCRSLLNDFGVSIDTNSMVNEDRSGDYLFCFVVYNDGVRENLSIRKFDNLIRNDAWRKLVLFIQGYIPYVSSQTGFYGSKKKVSI